MKSKNGIEWEYYAIGEVVRLSNLLILERTRADGTMTGTTYRVRKLCCGEEETTSHRTIRRRTSQVCDKCSMPMRAKRISEARRAREEAKRQRKERQLAKRIERGEVTVVRNIGRAEVHLEPGYHGWERPACVRIGYWLWEDAQGLWFA